MAKKIFILGIHSLISSENSTTRFGNDNEIVIPFPETLDELQKISPMTERGRIAKKILDYFSSFNLSKLLSKEGIIQSNGSTLRFEDSYRDYARLSGHNLNSLGQLSNFDKRRLEIALGLTNRADKTPVILVSKNPVFRMKANSIGLKAQNFKDDLFPDLNNQYKGRIECTTSQEKLDMLVRNGRLPIKAIHGSDKIEWITNMFLNIHVNKVSYNGETVPSILARYDGKEIVSLTYENHNPFNAKPMNAGQRMTIEALMQPAEIAPLTIIKGGAGTGKTFLSMAVALEKILRKNENGGFKHILISTPTETIREENLGYLPGELEQKFDPYLGGIMDNLAELLSSKKSPSNSVEPSNTNSTTEESSNTNNNRNAKRQIKKTVNGKVEARRLLENGTIEMQLLGHLRGRSIIDTIFIIDETQNIEPSVIKSIVSRIGKRSKFIFLGDPSQIDNPELNERYNGLVYLSEKMKGQEKCWQITLNDEESVRSELAYLAAKIL